MGNAAFWMFCDSRTTVFTLGMCMKPPSNLIKIWAPPSKETPFIPPVTLVELRYDNPDNLTAR